MRILPRRAWRRGDLFDTHALDTLREIVTVDAVAITNEKTWCFLVRKSINDLLGSPFSAGVGRHVEVNDLPAVMTKHDEHVQDAKGRCGDREEVAGGEERARDWREMSAKFETAASCAGPCTWPRSLRPPRGPAAAILRGFSVHPKSGSPWTCGESGHGFRVRWADVQVSFFGISSANTA